MLFEPGLLGDAFRRDKDHKKSDHIKEPSWNMSSFRKESVLPPRLIPHFLSKNPGLGLYTGKRSREKSKGSPWLNRT
jgi:hypothetical protein